MYPQIEIIIQQATLEEVLNLWSLTTYYKIVSLINVNNYVYINYVCNSVAKNLKKLISVAYIRSIILE